MKIIRAILLGILLWIVIFIEVSVLTFGFGLSRSSVVYNAIHFLLLVLFICLINLLYFRKKVKPDLFTGLIFGIILVIVGIILDAIITIPLFLNGNYNFLVSPDILVGDSLMIIVSLILGHFFKK